MYNLFLQISFLHHLKYSLSFELFLIQNEEDMNDKRKIETSFQILRASGRRAFWKLRKKFQNMFILKENMREAEINCWYSFDDWFLVDNFPWLIYYVYIVVCIILNHLFSVKKSHFLVHLLELFRFSRALEK